MDGTTTSSRVNSEAEFVAAWSPAPYCSLLLELRPPPSALPVIQPSNFSRAHHPILSLYLSPYIICFLDLLFFVSLPELNGPYTTVYSGRSDTAGF